MNTKITILISLFIFSLTSCREDSEQAFTQDEAAEQIAESLATDVSMSTTSMGSLSVESETSAGGRTLSVCGVQLDTTFADTYEGTYNTVTWSASYSYVLNCTGFIPSSLGITFSMNTDREGTRSNSESTNNGDFTISGFTGDSFIYNGEITRTAKHTLLYRENSEVSTSSTIKIIDLNVDKTTLEISSGTGTYELSGSTEEGTFSYTASIVYLSDDSATITINGTVYEVDLSSGQIL
jgi:hypothetical protein